jgi:electron transfer flavoprotein beta subunit
VDFNARTITLDKLLDEGIQTLTSVLPAVISLAQDINEPKYPSFIGIRKAAKAVILVWSSADLGIGEAASGSAAKVVTVGFTNLPAWEGSVEIIDGSSDAEKAEKLAARLFEDNVL